MPNDEHTHDYTFLYESTCKTEVQAITCKQGLYYKLSAYHGVSNLCFIYNNIENTWTEPVLQADPMCE